LSETGIVKHTLKNRYFQPNENNWSDVAKRVSNKIGKTTSQKEEFYRVINDKKFIPNSPTLMNAGTKINQFSACFVIPVPDDMEGIGNAVTNSMLISKSGGGVGYSFENIRPKNAAVASTNGVASGVVSFMTLFDAATEVVKQAGKRRGANMGVLPVWHPDIIDFINAKTTDGILSNFNLSVGITDDFLEAVSLDNDWEMSFEYNDSKITKTIKAKELFYKIIHNMWQNGEPGIVFLDIINKNNRFDERIKATNPCGEQPLIDYGACNLGSIDVSKFYIDDIFKWDEFRETIKTGVNFLNNTIDLNDFPLPQIKETVEKYRPIGLGLMGFADLLIKMKIIYGSDDSFEIAENIAATLYNTAKSAAEEYEKENNKNPNRTIISYAPTGTISLFAGCSSGIEPNFAYKYTRKTWSDGNESTFDQYHPLFEEYKENPPDYFIKAMDITPNKHIKMQSIFQKYCDSGISKTINVHNDSSEDNIYELIYEAWELGCKGFTMYRDGSRSTQVLNTTEKTERNLPKREEDLPGKTYKQKTGCGKMYATVNNREGKIYEVFISSAGNGGCAALLNGLGRSISIGLRHGVNPDEYIKQFSRVNCPACKGITGKSCPDIIGRILNQHKGTIEAQEEVKINKTYENKVKNNMCPECNSELRKSEGCSVCDVCGFSKCA